MEYLHTRDLEILPLRCGYHYSFPGMDKGTDYSLPQRRLTLYELDFFTTPGITEIDGTAVEFEKGSICFRRPGQLNRHLCEYECIFLQFDIVKKEDYADYRVCDHIRYDHILNQLPTKFPAEQCGELKNIINRIYDCYTIDTEFSSLMVKSQLYLLLAYLHQTACEDKLPFLHYNTSIKEAIRYIHKHLDRDLSIQTVAQWVGLSPKYFQKVFRESTGKTPNEYIIEEKLTKAKALLRQTDKAISDIAFECGFTNFSYFSRMFKKRLNKTPQEYRNAKQPLMPEKLWSSSVLSWEDSIYCYHDSLRAHGQEKIKSLVENGNIRFAGKDYFISDELSGETIVLMLFDSSSIWGVIYHDILLGTIDAKKKVMLYKQFPVLIDQEMRYERQTEKR